MTDAPVYCATCGNWHAQTTGGCPTPPSASPSGAQREHVAELIYKAHGQVYDPAIFGRGEPIPFDGLIQRKRRPFLDTADSILAVLAASPEGADTPATDAALRERLLKDAQTRADECLAGEASASYDWTPFPYAYLRALRDRIAALEAEREQIAEDWDRFHSYEFEVQRQYAAALDADRERATRRMLEAGEQLLAITRTLHLERADGEDAPWYLPASPGPVECATIAEAVEEAIRLCTDDAKRAEVKAERLADALRVYGRHKRSCSTRHGLSCNCGLSRALSDTD